MKRYIFFASAVTAVVCAAYWGGIKIGQEKCRANTAQHYAQSNMQIQKTMEKINAETVHSATGHIRNILRMQYTIAE